MNHKDVETGSLINSFAPIIASARCGLNHSLNISVRQYSSRETNISGLITDAAGISGVL